MKNLASKTLIGLLLAFAVFMASVPALATVTCGDINRLRCIATTSQTLTSGAFNGTVGATSPSTGSFTSLATTLGVTHTRTPAADSGVTNNTSKVIYTVPADTTGTNTHNAYDVALTVSNATGGTNTFNGWKLENYTGDAQVNVNGINIGTSDGLGTAHALLIGTGWTDGLNIASPIVGTSAANITINTNKFTVAASSGNTVVAGTLGVTGALTATGGVDGVLGGVTPAAATITTLSASGTATFAAGSSIVAKTSTTSTDINPPYDNRILGNPVVKYVYGSCSVAAVNGGTCIPLALGSSRTIAVLGYDIVAAGSAATCTGILLEDTNGTPVVVSTIAAAALTSGTHNFPGLANNVLGVGFGAGSGLTVSQGLQIKVNGSNCTTTTAFQYAITYAVQ